MDDNFDIFLSRYPTRELVDNQIEELINDILLVENLVIRDRLGTTPTHHFRYFLESLHTGLLLSTPESLVSLKGVEFNVSLELDIPSIQLIWGIVDYLMTASPKFSRFELHECRMVTSTIQCFTSLIQNNSKFKKNYTTGSNIGSTNDIVWEMNNNGNNQNIDENNSCPFLPPHPTNNNDNNIDHANKKSFTVHFYNFQWIGGHDTTTIAAYIDSNGIYSSGLRIQVHDVRVNLQKTKQILQEFQHLASLVHMKFETIGFSNLAISIESFYYLQHLVSNTQQGNKNYYSQSHYRGTILQSGAPYYNRHSIDENNELQVSETTFHECTFFTENNNTSGNSDNENDLEQMQGNFSLNCEECKFQGYTINTRDAKFLSKIICQVIQQKQQKQSQMEDLIALDFTNCDINVDTLERLLMPIIDVPHVKENYNHNKNTMVIGHSNKINNENNFEVIIPILVFSCCTFRTTTTTASIINPTIPLIYCNFDESSLEVNVPEHNSKASMAISAKILQASPIFQGLVSIDVNGDNVNDETVHGALECADQTHMHSLYLGGVGITDQGISLVAKALSLNTTLSSLCLCHVDSITPFGLRKLSKVIQEQNYTLMDFYCDKHHHNSNNIMSMNNSVITYNNDINNDNAGRHKQDPTCFILETINFFAVLNRLGRQKILKSDLPPQLLAELCEKYQGAFNSSIIFWILCKFPHVLVTAASKQPRQKSTMTISVTTDNDHDHCARKRKRSPHYII